MEDGSRLGFMPERIAMRVRTNAQNNLLCCYWEQLVFVELTQRGGLLSLANALRYLQAILGAQPVSLGELIRSDMLWMRLPARIRRMQRESPQKDWLVQAMQTDWEQVHLHLA